MIPDTFGRSPLRTSLIETFLRAEIGVAAQDGTIVFFSRILAALNQSAMRGREPFLDVPDWIVSAEVRASFPAIVRERLPYHVRLPYDRAIENPNLLAFVDENLSGKMVAFVTQGMNYYFSGENDAIFFKLAFG